MPSSLPILLLSVCLVLAAAGASRLPHVDSDACANRTLGYSCILSTGSNRTLGVWLSLYCETPDATELQVCGAGCNLEDGQCLTNFAAGVSYVALGIVLTVLLALVVYVVAQGMRMARHLAAVRNDMTAHGLLVDEVTTDV
jgi:hypothetical protein